MISENIVELEKRLSYLLNVRQKRHITVDDV